MRCAAVCGVWGLQWRGAARPPTPLPPPCLPAALRGALPQQRCSSCSPPPWAVRLSSSSGSDSSCCSSACRWTPCGQAWPPATGPRPALWRHLAAAPLGTLMRAVAGSWRSCRPWWRHTTLASSCPLLSAACGSKCSRLERLQRQAFCQVRMLPRRCCACCACCSCGVVPCCVCPPRQLCRTSRAVLCAVCLRGLASPDAGCRAAAYQAVALFEAQLPAPSSAHGFREAQQLRWARRVVHKGSWAAVAPPGPARECAEPMPSTAPLLCCSVLLGALRAAVTRPFQRLPAVTAVFLAEAGAISTPGWCLLRMPCSTAQPADLPPAAPSTAHSTAGAAPRGPALPSCQQALCAAGGPEHSGARGNGCDGGGTQQPV